MDERREQLRATLPIRRAVGPADIAAFAVHLMSNTAVTGATIVIDVRPPGPLAGMGRPDQGATREIPGREAAR